MKLTRVLLALACMLMAATAWGDNRPVPIYAAPSGEASVQQILNCLTVASCGGVAGTHDPINQPNTPVAGAPNAATDQLGGGGIFTLDPPTATGNDLTLKFTNSAFNDTFGLVQAGGGSSFKLFENSDGLNTHALVTWNTQTSGFYNVFSTSNVLLRSGAFNNINLAGFGVYIGGVNGTYYSEDSLNPVSSTPGGSTNARILVYENGKDLVFFGEDGTDFDYNDISVTAQSIAPVPEPASMVMFGSGLLGIAGAVRRKLGR